MHETVAAIPPARAPWRRALLVTAVWFAVSLLFLPQALLINAASKQAPWPIVAGSNLAIFLLWALLTPLVLRLAERLPLGRGRWRHGLALHLAAAVALSLLHVLLMTALHLPGLPDQVPVLRLYLSLLTGLGATNVLLYFGIVAVGHAQAYLARFRAGERARAQAQLAALRAQLHPHFLFNTLNALSELVHRDARLAERLILRLSELLRRVLVSGDAQELTLAEELDFSRAYLDIQQALMGERLRVSIDVADALLAARVPNMLLQPLVENAIRHGLAKHRAGGTLRIAAAGRGGRLQIDVEDDGAGAQGAWREGIGLSNTRARLAALYGEAAALDCLPLEPGFRVRVGLPLRFA